MTFLRPVELSTFAHPPPHLPKSETDPQNPAKLVWLALYRGVQPEAVACGSSLELTRVNPARSLGQHFMQCKLRRGLAQSPRPSAEKTCQHP